MIFLLLGLLFFPWPPVALSGQNSEIWGSVEKLANEQKMQAALNQLLELKKSPAIVKSAELSTEALVRETQLRLSLHGYETAVKELKNAPWPKDPRSQILLNLYYGQALANYQQSYSWEINGREKNESKESGDLKLWTTQQIGQAISQSFDEAIKQSAPLNEKIPPFFQSYYTLNNYPEGIRPLLRDGVVYMAVSHLQNTQFWTPQQSAEIDQIAIGKLLGASELSKPRIAAGKVEVHPVERIASWLNEHYQYHLKAGRKEAAVEARYQLFESLNGIINNNDDKQTLLEQLRQFQSHQNVGPWWARGQALVAQMIRQQPRPGALVEAVSEAQKGASLYPQSYGGKLCQAILESIQQTQFQIQNMATDGKGRPSLLLQYKNLSKIYLRAYDYDLVEALTALNSSGNLLSYEKVNQLSGPPVAQWEESLAPTKDFALHRHFITPPLKNAGTYVILVSSDPGFQKGAGVTLYTYFIQSQIVLTSLNQMKGSLEVRTLNGDTGLPQPSTEVTLYRYQWDRNAQKVESKTSDSKGQLVFSKPPGQSDEYWNYFLIGRQGPNWATSSTISFNSEGKEPQDSRSLFYTDRSVYRPEQKLFWKAVLYTGKASTGEWSIAKKATPVIVQLLDPNHQVVSSLNVKTNEFGTTSGEFKLPAGRPLGGWQVRIDKGYPGSASVSVEEYKRPTFEGQLADAKEPLRLNRPAKISGEVKYYFGQPVSAGSVRWRITRAVQTPWWWEDFGFWWRGPQQAPQVVAIGQSALKANGTFDLQFLPTGDERKALINQGQDLHDLSYIFTVNADMTDEGGETRSTSRSYRIGFSSVEASLNWDNNFFVLGEKNLIAVQRTNLDGKTVKGSGQYKIVRLQGPPHTLTPASYPRSESSEQTKDAFADLEHYGTPSDLKRARWETDTNWKTIAATWPEGEIVQSGILQQSADDNPSLELNKIKLSGVYKISYETKDDFGTPYHAARLFLVAEPKPKLPLPFLILPKKNNYEVGEKAQFLIHSGLEKLPMTLEIYQQGLLRSRRQLESLKDLSLLEIPVTSAERGGFTVAVTALKDYQWLRQEFPIYVPWTDRHLLVEFSSFRDRLRPGTKETFRVTVKNSDQSALTNGPAEILASMYDRSLDLFGPYSYPSISSLYPWRQGAISPQITLHTAFGYQLSGSFPNPRYPDKLNPDWLRFYARYGIGGPGARGGMDEKVADRADGMVAVMAAPRALMASAPMAPGGKTDNEEKQATLKKSSPVSLAGTPPNKAVATDISSSPDAGANLRTQFSETAFFYPHLVTDKAGSVGFEFQVPDSVTSWRVFAHALTKDLRGGFVEKEAKSVKELMVRPYAPRFLREGDSADIKVAINNAGESELSGELLFELENLDSNTNALKDFGFRESIVKRPFKVAKGETTTLTFPLQTPKMVGLFAFKVSATAKNKGLSYTDGERRPFPVLPSRMHLAQSRFVTLKNQSHQTLEFKDLAKKDDPSLINEKMVVTLDAQLFYGVLKSLPYLIEYPYECTEQTLNKFISTGIIRSLFKKFPAMEKMAKTFSSRQQPYERFDDTDANRRMTLEETPWLQEAQGLNPGAQNTDEKLVNVLDSRITQQTRDRALNRLAHLQLPGGGFPWFDGGAPDRYMTLYALMSFGKALEFKVDVPKEMIVKAWNFTHQWIEADLNTMMAHKCCWEDITLANYAVSLYPDASWSGNKFDLAYRTKLLNYSFEHWKSHSPLLKGYLALTLHRMNRQADAKLVWDSVMDSAKTEAQLGTFWAPEDRSWLWYNDTIETHAFSLRTLMELNKNDPRNEGLVQWLFLNKKLNHWKSTRATAEVIYSLAHYLDSTATLANKEVITVDLGNQKTDFVFDPEQYTGRKNQIVIPGNKVIPEVHSQINISKSTPGFAFASAVWHFSTDVLPKEDHGDFFQLNRQYFRRENNGKEWILKPLSEGQKIRVGDQIEVLISLRTKHEAEYVHLRDPRGAGFEPESVRSGYKYDLGLSWFEEIRDSGTNFFFNSLPVGEYTFKYRLRATMAGTFRVGPATVQSMYAPEFNAYSAGHLLKVSEAQ